MIATVTLVDGSTLTLPAELDGVDDDGLIRYVLRVDLALDQVAGIEVDLVPARSSLHIVGVPDE